jgi:hypothetical protein
MRRRDPHPEQTGVQAARWHRRAAGWKSEPPYELRGRVTPAEQRGAGRRKRRSEGGATRAGIDCSSELEPRRPKVPAPESGSCLHVPPEGRRRGASHGHPALRHVSSLRGKLLTGEPDAGDPHVRFGGRGGANHCAVPTPYHSPLRFSSWVYFAYRNPVLPHAGGDHSGSEIPTSLVFSELRPWRTRSNRQSPGAMPLMRQGRSRGSIGCLQLAGRQ